MATGNRVEDWYDAHADIEERRLEENRLEFKVTRRIIDTCIASLRVGKAKILDIGGGPGRYAISLAKQQHTVTLSDLSAKSLEIAQIIAKREAVELNAVIHADARQLLHISTLQEAQSSFDVVLCMGPLYHLLTLEERAKVIRNSISMTRSGGFVLLAYVTVYAHLRDLARRDPSRLAKEWDFYEQYLQGGEYTRNSENYSYHMYPSDLNKELKLFENQVRVERVISCEGFLGSSNAKELGNLIGEELARWVDVVMLSAESRETVNSADHLLVVLRKL